MRVTGYSWNIGANARGNARLGNKNNIWLGLVARTTSERTVVVDRWSSGDDIRKGTTRQGRNLALPQGYQVVLLVNATFDRSNGSDPSGTACTDSTR